jgi:hypothetical protein
VQWGQRDLCNARQCDSVCWRAGVRALGGHERPPAALTHRTHVQHARKPCVCVAVVGHVDAGALHGWVRGKRASQSTPGWGTASATTRREATTSIRPARRKDVRQARQRTTRIDAPRVRAGRLLRNFARTTPLFPCERVTCTGPVAHVRLSAWWCRTAALSPPYLAPDDTNVAAVDGLGGAVHVREPLAVVELGRLRRAHTLNADERRVVGLGALAALVAEHAAPGVQPVDGWMDGEERMEDGVSTRSKRNTNSNASSTRPRSITTGLWSTRHGGRGGEAGSGVRGRVPRPRQRTASRASWWMACETVDCPNLVRLLMWARCSQ